MKYEYMQNLSVTASPCPCPGCGSQRLLRCRLHPAGRCPNSDSLFPPLAAVVAVAYRGEALAFRKVFPLRQRLPSLGELSAKQTERLLFVKPLSK